MKYIRSSNLPVATGIFDPNKSRVLHRRNRNCFSSVFTLHVIFSKFYISFVGFAFLQNLQNHLKQIIIFEKEQYCQKSRKISCLFNTSKTSSEIGETIKKTSSPSLSSKPSLQLGFTKIFTSFL